MDVRRDRYESEETVREGIAVPTLSVAELEADPHGQFRFWRPRLPFVAHEAGCFLVLRAGDIERLTRDPRLRATETAYPEMRGIPQGALFDIFAHGMLTANGAVHRRRRSPFSRTSPASGWYTPAITFISVDLPAPFSPTTASTSPRWRRHDTLSSASTPGNCLRMPVASMRGVSGFKFQDPRLGWNTKPPLVGARDGVET